MRLPLVAVRIGPAQTEKGFLAPCHQLQREVWGGVCVGHFSCWVSPGLDVDMGPAWVTLLFTFLKPRRPLISRVWDSLLPYFYMALCNIFFELHWFKAVWLKRTEISLEEIIGLKNRSFPLLPCQSNMLWARLSLSSSLGIQTDSCLSALASSWVGIHHSAAAYWAAVPWLQHGI